MRRILVWILLAFPISLYAQGGFTTVTGTVTDPNGVKWACGTISAQLVTAGGAAPTLNGGGFTTVTAPVQLGCPTIPGSGASGSFTMRLADSGVISPGNTTWKFMVNTTGTPPPLGTGPQSFTYTTAINCSTNTPTTCTNNALDISTPISASALALTASGVGGGITSGAVAANTILIGPSCTNPNSQNCYFANLDVHVSKNCTTANLSATITCTDGNFQGTDSLGRPIAKNGQPVMCIGAGGVNAPVSQVGTLTINSNTQITSSANSNATSSICAWGDDDYSLLNAIATAILNTASVNAPAKIKFSSGYLFSHGCLFNNVLFPNNGTPNAYFAPTFEGDGQGSTQIIFLPLISQGGTFDLTTCPAGAATNPGLFGPSNQANSITTYYKNFTITGLGNNLNGINMGGRSLIGGSVSAFTILDHVNLWGFGAAATNWVGIQTASQGSSYTDFNVDGAGATPLVNVPNGAGTVSFRNAFIGDSNAGSALVVGGGGSFPCGGNVGAGTTGTRLISYGGVYTSNSPGDAIQVSGGCYEGHGDSTNANSVIQGNALRVINGGEAVVDGGLYQTNTSTGNGCLTAGGSTIRASKTKCVGGATGNGVQINNAADRFIDVGANIFAGNPTFSFVAAGSFLGEANSANQIAVTAAKLVLSAGWGASAANTALTGGDFPIQFTITNTGAGQAANPTITYTFPTPLPVAPFSCTATQTGGTNASLAPYTASVPTVTGVTFTATGTPTAGSTEIMQVTCVTP